MGKTRDTGVKSAKRGVDEQPSDSVEFGQSMPLRKRAQRMRTIESSDTCAVS